MGVPGKSNAIEIASRLGLNPSIVEDAKKELSNTSSETSELISNLEEEMTSLRNQERELESKIKSYEAMVNNLKLEKLDLVKKTDKIIHDAKEEAKRIIEEAKEESSKLIEEIKNMSDENFKEHELIALKTKAKNLSVKDEVEEIFDEDLHVGDYVYVKTYEKYGTISSIKKDKYYVNLGQFAIEFKKNELSLAAKPVEKKKKEQRLSGYNPASHATLSLDLRGKRVEELKELMDSYLDQCALGNLKQVSIIHGFGTGAVRKAVQEYLKTSTYVKSYRYGGEGEGLNGVTVVYLK
jgi:DNA mismatch repair protein MutS2